MEGDTIGGGGRGVGEPRTGIIYIYIYLFIYLFIVLLQDAQGMRSPDHDSTAVAAVPCSFSLLVRLCMRPMEQGQTPSSWPKLEPKLE